MPFYLNQILHCPKCEKQHVDEGEWAKRLHRTHLCAFCGHEWIPEGVGKGLCTFGVASMSAETLSREERIERAMANTTVDDIIAGNPADPYARFAKTLWSYMDKEQAEGRHNRTVQMHPALGAPYYGNPPTKIEMSPVTESTKESSSCLSVDQQILDARRWQALMACARMRVIGTGSLGTLHAHLGLELWGLYPKLNEEDLQNVASAREMLTRFVDGVEK